MAGTGDINIQPHPEYWSRDFFAESSIDVPMKGCNDVLTIDFGDRSKILEKQEILDVLRDEDPPIRVWNIIALHYYVRDYPDIFVAILEKAREHIARGSADTSDAAFCLDLLANYYALGLVEKKAEKERKALSDKVMTLCTQVDKLFIYSQYHLIGRAYYCLLDGQEKLDQAVKQFDYVLTVAPTDALALQGRGIAAFHQGDFKKALSCFKKILTYHPGCTGDIRVGIGHCLFKLGHLEKAQRAYRRAIKLSNYKENHEFQTQELDKHCLQALIGLGLILWNEGTSQSVKEALFYIGRVQKEEIKAKRANPVTLNLLADHYFFRREPDNALKFSSLAIQSSFNETLKAESAYSVGRSYHYRDEYEQAFQYYYQATQFAKPSYVLPWYGLGQMYIQRKEYTNAIQCFEKVLVGSPNNIETLKILGLLYLSADVKEKKTLARTYLKKVTELCPDDVDAHIKFAELQESIDPQSALNTYLRVIQIFKDQSDHDQTPPEILNNISVLYFCLGQIEESRKFLEWACRRAELEQPSNEVHYRAIRTTMMYNQGRILEELRETEDAEKCYRRIAEGDYPKYLPFYHRYGNIARDRGNILKASDWYKEAAHANPDDPDSHLLLGNLHMAKGEYGPAQKKYEKVLDNPSTKTDTYALLSLGNIWLETLYQNIPDVEKKKRHAERAFMLYKQVLKLDPFNVYAVNGMGAVLAKTGQLEEAKEMFSVVRESTADMLDLWLNIGHSYCDQRQYVAGIKMYENALKRFKEAALDPAIFLYLSRAQYFHGDLKDARKTLQLARRLAPQNPTLRYNQAVVLKRMALFTFGDARNVTSPTLAEVQGAVQDLKIAKRIFKFFATVGADKSVVEAGRAERERKKCKDLLLISKAKLDDAENNDLEALRKRQINEEARLAYQKLIDDEQRVQEEAKKKVQEELLRKRQEVLERTVAVKEKIIRQETEPDFKPARTRKRKPEGGEEDYFIDDQGNRVSAGDRPAKRQRGEAGGEARRNRKAARRKRREERLEAGLPVSSGEENDEPEAAASSRRRSEPEYDRKGRRLKSAAFVDTSSDSSSSDSENDAEKKNGSGDEDKGVRAAAKKALASSDDEEDSRMEEKSAAKKKTLASSDDDEDTAPARKTKRVVADSDDDEIDLKTGNTVSLDDAGTEPPEDDAAEEDGQPTKRAKMSLNESDSDF